MRFLIDEIRRSISSFISGSHHILMLLACEPEESALVLKTIDNLEDDPNVTDVFLTFGQPFDDVFSYVDAIIKSIQEQSDQLNIELAKRGDPPLSNFPEELKDSSAAPFDRLSKSMQYVRDIVPLGRRAVWIFHPLKVRIAEAYIQLFRHIRSNLDNPALRGTRVVVRDSATSPMLVGLFKDDHKVRLYKPELGAESLEKKLTAQANKPGVPFEEQAQIHMMLAGIDVANKRFDVALGRNQELLGYFYHSGNKHNQSIVLNNIGDLHYVQGKFADAQEWYQKAILVAVELKSQPLLLYQSMNLGNSLVMQRKFDEAWVYYNAAEKLARASNVPVYEIQALEQIGRLKLDAGQLDEAAQSWEKASDLSKKLGYEAGQRALLERLRDLYRQSAQNEKLRQCERALSEIPSS
jgi:tetratricopeptide (TPR) repeat protein